MANPNSLLIGVLALVLAGCASSPKPGPSPAAGSSAADFKDISPARQIVTTLARESIGKPYAWGGISPDNGFDCSGLVIYTHARAGVHLPRTARDQFDRGKAVLPRNLMPGDLVFFDVSRFKKSYHVGIYMGKDSFIHAPGKGKRVREASLATPYFAKHFIGARTYL